MANTETNVVAFDYIDSLKVSAGWKNRFKKIYIGYCNNFYLGASKNPLLWTMASHTKDWDFSQKIKYNAHFNLWALVFGPFYYLAKQMYSKGIALFIILALIFALFQFEIITGTIFWLLCAILFLFCSYSANIDYFCKNFLMLHDFQNNPDLLTNSWSAFEHQKIMKENPLNSYISLAVVLVFAIFILASFVKIFVEANDESYFKSGIEHVCKNRSDCISLTEKLNSKLGSNRAKGTALEYYKMACAQYWLNDKKSALNYIIKAKGKDNESIKILSAAAQINSELGRYQEAVQIYEYILKLYPEKVYVNYYIGQTYYRARRYFEALKAFKIATSHYPNRANYFEAQAYTKIYMKDSKGAKQDIEHALNLYKKSNKNDSNLNKIQNLEKYYMMLK